MSKLIINCKTGETVERELNAEELAQKVIDEAAEAARQSEIEAAEAAALVAAEAEEAAKQQAFNDAVAAAVAATLAAQNNGGN
jgi:hypothetical protein